MNDKETQGTTPSASPALAPAGGSGNSLADEMLTALRRLTKDYRPHPCGGFTTDDMEWRMGTAFTGEEALTAALDELQAAKLIRYAGYDEEDAIGHCYEICQNTEIRHAGV